MLLKQDEFQLENTDNNTNKMFSLPSQYSGMGLIPGENIFTSTPLGIT
jgi:hypothetical protein